jgi:hypothetical protein
VGRPADIVSRSRTVTGLESIELAVEENSVSIGPQGVQITGLTNQIQAEVQLQTQALAEQLSQLIQADVDENITAQVANNPMQQSKALDAIVI